jgi:16S rRNA (guanine527-N7)-methyltransferase
LGIEALESALAALGVALPEEALTIVEAHVRLVLEANRQLNLTRITAPDEIAVAHVADSLACLLAIPGGPADLRHSATGNTRPPTLIDVGTGAGFPGVVLAAARPGWAVTLLESAHKKAAFLESAVSALGVADRVSVVCARAEEAGRAAPMREGFDVTVARAVGALPVVAEYLLPLVRVGGVAIAMRGAAAPDELAAAGNAIAKLGGKPARLVEYSLPGLAARRYLVIMEKGRKTPTEYPRRPGIPARQPLS